MGFDDHTTSERMAVPSYLVVVSPSYGGAEKRFFDIFRAMRARGADVQLIVPSSLGDRLLGDHAVEPEVASAVIPVAMDTWSPAAFVRGYRAILRTLPRGSHFHYPMNCLWPLHIGRGDKLSMSVTECFQTPTPFTTDRTMLRTWASFFFVDRIDVLSPSSLSRMARYRMARKMSLTPGGTFIEAQPIGGVSKAPAAVTLSRLIPGKGVDDLLDVLPAVWARLKPYVPADFSFQIAGNGPLAEHIEARVAGLSQSGVPVAFLGYADALQLFARVAVVLSMQAITNYPSRVVAEALASGCGVIVRDTGDSRMFGPDVPGLVYCKADLDADELAGQIRGFVEAVTTDPAFSNTVQQAALEKFSAKQSVDYFLSLMGGPAI